MTYVKCHIKATLLFSDNSGECRMVKGNSCIKKCDDGIDCMTAAVRKVCNSVRHTYMKPACWL